MGLTWEGDLSLGTETWRCSWALCVCTGGCVSRRCLFTAWFVPLCPQNLSRRDILWMYFWAGARPWEQCQPPPQKARAGAPYHGKVQQSEFPLGEEPHVGEDLIHSHLPSLPSRSHRGRCARDPRTFLPTPGRRIGFKVIPEAANSKSKF